MIVHFQDKEYTWNDSIDVRTAVVIKAHTGLNLLPWYQAIREGDPAACQAFLWALKKQNGETTEIAGNVDFVVTDLVQAYVRALLAEMENVPEKMPDPTASPKGSTPNSKKTSATSEPATSSS